MRWFIEENKKKISSFNFEGHADDIEMGGEKVSCIVKYSVEKNVLSTSFLLVYPMVRVQPNDTFGSYKVNCKTVNIGLGDEYFDKVEFDGTLKIFTHCNNLQICHTFFPSVKNAVFYEQIQLKNNGSKPICLNYEKQSKLDSRIACRGYIKCLRIAKNVKTTINSGEEVKLLFAYAAVFSDDTFRFEQNALKERQARVRKLMGECDLTTGNDIVDTMFAFAKLHAGENIFNTSNGRVHSPGGGIYYAAVWCNDQCEYSTPWFAFTGDDILNEAARNAIRWYLPYLNDDFYPIPSSIISEGYDYWNGACDRGDAAMLLFGSTRYFLISGNTPNEDEQKILDWCASYIEKKMRSDGIVVSDTDELENRLTSGINLSTSSLAYSGFKYYAILKEKQGNKKAALRYKKLAQKIRCGIESYFGYNVKGYNTYRYHEGCNEIRAWTCLPVYMKIFDRQEDVLKSIGDHLWINNGCVSTEGEKITWDRSTLYYIASLFRAGKTEEGWQRLVEYSQNRLLGERVPYAIEAYPENGMRHLSAESALYCRVLVDGLLDIDCVDNAQISVNARLPEELSEVALSKVNLGGKIQNISIKKQ